MAILIYDQHNGSRPRGIWTREFNGIEWNLMILFLELDDANIFTGKLRVKTCKNH